MLLWHSWVVQVSNMSSATLVFVPPVCRAVCVQRLAASGSSTWVQSVLPCFLRQKGSATEAAFAACARGRRRMCLLVNTCSAQDRLGQPQFPKEMLRTSTSWHSLLGKILGKCRGACPEPAAATNEAKLGSGKVTTTIRPSLEAHDKIFTKSGCLWSCIIYIVIGAFKPGCLVALEGLAQQALGFDATRLPLQTLLCPAAILGESCSARVRADLPFSIRNAVLLKPSEIVEMQPSHSSLMWIELQPWLRSHAEI